MKKITALVLSFLFFPQLVFAYYNPGQPTGFVNDFAGVIDSGAKTKLESDLQKFEIDTKHEIAVVTIKSLQDDTIENFAVKLFEDWKIGKKGADNGVLLLVALDDRKMRIEVGYGLEGALPDATAYQIINQIIKPEFQAGDYTKGIVDGTSAIMAAVKGEDVSSLVAASSNETGTSKALGKVFGELAYFIFIAVFFFIRILTYKLSQSKRWWPGGLLGVGFGLVISLFVVGFALSMLWWGLAFGLFGLLMDYVMSKKGPPKGGPGGGMFWGGFGGGGGSGGGGFGGFGGGGSGGGGSSGSW
ncbi:MAG: TPM domain-containing protein [Candidatus Magasanikbacteria bacterium]|nr:TPM domain-containing protein [Candidatus Magasanikbacteria bacterium]